MATIIATQNLVDLSVNEFDAAKIAVGQKATLTFDAIPDLSLTGTVVQVDPAGTVSQGVVTYGVEISLDTQDSRVKTGMSVNATIQTAVAEDVLVVPSAAIKTTNGMSYVQVFSPPLAASSTGSTASQGVVSATPPINVTITTGISDTTNTEVLSGLTAGEQIVIRTTTGAATTVKTTAAAATSRTTGAGGGFGGGGGGASVRL